MMKNKREINISTNTIMGMLAMFVMLVALFYAAKFVFNLLWWIAPVLLIATLIIDHKVFLGYINWIIRMVKKSPLVGIGAILLSIFGFPVVSALLFGRALLGRNLKKFKAEHERRTKGEFVEYEELDSEPLILPDIEEPRPKQERKAQANDDYEQLFD